MTPAQVKQLYQQRGAEFITPATAIAQRLGVIRALVLDWDGVFNNGSKSTDGSSTWSEPDVTGINLFRFSSWLQRKKVLPVIVISGEKNPALIKLARRERFDGVFFNIKNKVDALNLLGKKQWNLKPAQLIYVFDDVIDLSIASRTQLRFLVRRNESPVFERYVREKGFADYISFSSGGNGAVREITELCMALDGVYEKTIKKRTQYEDDYRAYEQERNLVETIFYTREHKRIVKTELPYTD